MRLADRLLGAFKRLLERGELSGSGVGLATVTRILQRHRGRIRTGAAMNRGATFDIARAGVNRLVAGCTRSPNNN